MMIVVLSDRAVHEDFDEPLRRHVNSDFEAPLHLNAVSTTPTQ